MRKYKKEEIEYAIKNSKNASEAIKNIGLPEKRYSHLYKLIKRFNIDTSHFVKINVNKINKKIYTKEECEELAKKYTHRQEFRLMDWSAYKQAKDNGWLDDILPKVKRDLTYEHCYNIAKNFDSYTDFHKKEDSVYCKANEKGLLKDYVWLKRNKRDFESKINCVYVYEFIEFNSIYIGRTMNIVSRHYRHLHTDTDSVYKFMKQHNIKNINYKIIENNLNTQESVDKECFYIDKYKNEGWKLINKAKGGSIGGTVVKWAYKACKDIAKQCATLTEFYAKYPTVANKCARMKWSNDFYWLFKKH